MQYRRKHLVERDPAVEKDLISFQPDLDASGPNVISCASAGRAGPPLVSLPKNPNSVSKPTTEEYLVQIQERFDDQIRAPPIPCTSTNGINKTVDGSTFTGTWTSSQVVVFNDLIICAIGTRQVYTVMAVEMGSTIDIILCTSIRCSLIY